MAIQVSGKGEANQNQGQKASGDGPTAKNQDVQNKAPQQRDYAHQLTETITTAFTQRGKSEPVIVSGIQQRAELYEKAFVRAKQVAIDTSVDGAAPIERRARLGEALGKADVEVLPPALVAKLAALDARQYGKLQDPQHQSETARLGTGYRTALAAKAPEVSGVVETAMAAADKARKGNAVRVPGDGLAMPRQAASDTSRSATMTLDPGALERVAANRARDVQTVAEQLRLNGIEQAVERKQQARRDAQAEEQRAAFKGAERSQSTAMQARAAEDNQVASDEVFTASRDEVKPIVPADVEDKYLRVGKRFYHPKDTHVFAFEDKGNKLQTRSNSEQIAATMVAIARARGWDEIKVSGSETFRKEVWLEAAAHGMQVRGYIPSDVDKAKLEKRTRPVEVNQVEADSRGRGREATQASNVSPSKSDKLEQAEKVHVADDRQSVTEEGKRAKAFAQQPVADAIIDHPELAGTYAAMASMKKKAAADGLSPQQRAVVMERVAANLVNSIERGALPEVKVREQVKVRRERAEKREIKR
jgi:hypothetical protein